MKKAAFILLALCCASRGQVVTVPNTTMPAARALINANFAWLVANKVTYQGAWSSGTPYNAMDLVTYSGASYVSLQAANTAENPATQGAWWAQLSAAGYVVLSTGSGAPSANCAAPSASNLAVYIDTSNADEWWCYTTNSWKKTLSVTGSGPYVVTGATGTAPSAPSSGLVTCYFDATATNQICLDSAGDAFEMVKGISNPSDSQVVNYIDKAGVQHRIAQTSQVTSVFGRTGAVTASAMDYSGIYETAGVSTANLVAEYTLAEGGGGYAYNYTYPPTPNYNLVGPSEQQFAPGSTPWTKAAATATDAYAADPNGDFVASRIQIAASAGGYLAATNGVTYIVGQQYTLSIYVASNTGSGQTIRMTDNNVSYSGALSVPATGWVRLSYTWTASGSGKYVIPINQDSGGDALDLLIWGVQLEIGPHPTTYIPPVYTMVNGGGPQNTGAACSWISAGIDCTANSGSSYLSAPGWQPIDLSTATIYAAVKWTGSTVLSGYAPILSGPYGAPYLYLAGIDSGVPFPRFRFAGLTAYAYAANLNDSRWHIVAGEYDGANISLYLDGAQVAIYSVGSNAPIQIPELFLSNFGNSAYWPGQIGYAALYTAAHSTALVASNSTAIRSIMAARGVSIPALSQLLVFEGDSITDPTTGVAAASKYGYVAQAAISPFPEGANDAVSGSSIANLTTRAPTVDGWFAQVSGLKVLMVLVGANDQGEGASTFEASLKTYCLARKTATPGLKIVLATLLPQTTSGFNAFRDAVNTLIYGDSSFYDALADFAADATMGCDACSSNATYFPDGEHPSAAGHAILGPIAQAAIQSVGIL